MIVENGSVTMDLDLNGVNGSGSLVARPVTLQFAVGANSFFPILVFNDLLRGPEPGSMALIPAGVNLKRSRASCTELGLAGATPATTESAPIIVRRVFQTARDRKTSFGSRF